MRYNIAHYRCLAEGDGPLKTSLDCRHACAATKPFACAIFAAGCLCSPVWAAAISPASVVPSALADLRGFRGRIDYEARRDGLPSAPVVTGTLVVRDGTWTLDEQTARYALHAGSTGSSIDIGGTSAAVDDLFAPGALSNAWAGALGVIATEQGSAIGNERSWTFAELCVFVDFSGARMLGISDLAGAGDTSYALSDWTRAGALDVPGRILRIRAGLPDAAFTIGNYRVTPAPAEPHGDGRLVPFSVATRQHARDAETLAGGDSAPSSRLVYATAGLACVLLVVIAALAWLRKDVLLQMWCRRLSRDARGWRRAGVCVFVEPDGALHFDGMRYRVGPHFYNRAALVQSSALFLRISAPAVPRAVIVPRKFRPIDLGIRLARTRRAAAGFTLVETLFATAMFAAVVLLGVYPALVAVARADAMAAERAQAVVLASNALADEEAVNDYDGGAPLGSATTVIDGLTLTVTVSTGSIRSVSDLDVMVTDSGGTTLAHLTSWLGIPVKSPPNSGGPPGG